MGEHPRALSKNERVVLAAGGAAAVVSFLPGYISMSFDGPGSDASFNAWSGSATIGMVLLLGATALVGIEGLSDDTLPTVIPWHLIAVVSALLGTFIIVLRALTAGSSSAPGVSVGPGWSAWPLFIAAGVVTYFTVRTLRDAGDHIEHSPTQP